MAREGVLGSTDVLDLGSARLLNQPEFQIDNGSQIVLLVVECKKTDRISSGTEDFPHINSHLTYNHINT